MFISGYANTENVFYCLNTSLVRPTPEYASAALHSFLTKNISALERVQRKAARFCSQNYNRYASVTDMLRDLGWATLETRRRQFRLTLRYKLTHGLIDIDRRKTLKIFNVYSSLGLYMIMSQYFNDHEIQSPGS